MIIYPQQYKIRPAAEDTARILQKAEQALAEPVLHITDIPAPGSPGGIHDYCSFGDYWWPNPDTPDRLPYIRRDGESNPDSFAGHRRILRTMRRHTVYLACAYRLTGEERYAAGAARILREFFVEERTRMNPSLDYAQAIPGVCKGRGIGIIDTLHLADIPFAVQAISASPSVTETLTDGLLDWFSEYLDWMMNSPNGTEERNTDNNHRVCYVMQAASFALFTENRAVENFCREQFRTALLEQMAADGSFPRELARTKPYNYSIFILDNLVSICQMLSSPGDDLWDYTLEDGRGIRRALQFLTPYLLDRSAWPYPGDVSHFESLPARASFMLFAGYHYGMEELIRLYRRLPPDCTDEEIERNTAVCQPMLWLT